MFLVISLICSLILSSFIWFSVKLKIRHGQYKHFPMPPMCGFYSGHFPVVKQRTEQDGHMFNLYFEWVNQYGDVWCRFLFWKPGIIVMSQEGIKDMLVTNGGLPKMVDGASTYFDGTRLAGYGGLLAHTGGHAWLTKRQSLEPAFSKHYLKSLIPQMNEVTDSLIKQIKLCSTTKKAINMRKLMQKAAIDLICCVGFDVDYTHGDKDSMREVDLVEDLFDGLFNAALDPTFMYNPWKREIKNKAKNTIQPMRSMGHDALNKRLQKMKKGEKTPNDLLAHSINIQKLNSWYTNEEIVDDFITFFIAGSETTANVLSFTLAHLARNPSLYDKAVFEAESILEGSPYITEEDLTKLNYIECILNESMRLHPAASLIRRMTDKLSKIDKYMIPGDTTVITIPYVQARRASIWTDPLTFNPDRFLHTNIKKVNFMPFLIGPRRCIGSNFAMMKMKIMLSRIITEFHIRPKAGEDQIQPALKMTLYPKIGADLHIHPKTKHSHEGSD